MPNRRHCGREELEWSELVATTTAFLEEQARMERTTTYTELNAVLARRTAVRPFDFSEESERAAMGALLGEVAHAHVAEIGAMLSAIVIYLNENDAGTGFYRYAVDLGILPAHPTPEAKTKFWVSQVRAVHSHFSGSASADV